MLKGLWGVLERRQALCFNSGWIQKAFKALYEQTGCGLPSRRLADRSGAGVLHQTPQTGTRRPKLCLTAQAASQQSNPAARLAGVKVKEGMLHRIAAGR